MFYRPASFNVNHHRETYLLLSRANFLILRARSSARRYPMSERADKLAAAKPLPSKQVGELAQLSRCPEYPKGLVRATDILAAEVKSNKTHPILDFFNYLIRHFDRDALAGVDATSPARELFLAWHSANNQIPRAPNRWPDTPPEHRRRTEVRASAGALPVTYGER